MRMTQRLTPSMGNIFWQQFVPEEQKDDKYWERRRKNNVAAKRARDAQRIKMNQIMVRSGLSFCRGTDDTGWFIDWDWVRLYDLFDRPNANESKIYLQIDGWNDWADSCNWLNYCWLMVSDWLMVNRMMKWLNGIKRINSYLWMDWHGARSRIDWMILSARLMDGLRMI